MKKLSVKYSYPLLLSLALLLSCQDQIFIPVESEILIEKVYFNDTALVETYIYNDLNQLVRRHHHNPTVPHFNSRGCEYKYNKDGLLARIDTYSIDDHRNDNTADTSFLSEEFYYDDKNWLIEYRKIYEGSTTIKIFFVYDSKKRITESHVGELTYDESICENFDPNSGFGIDPILYTTHEYDENNNVSVETAIHCGRHIMTKPKYDAFKRPNDGLTYIPKFYDIAGFSLTRLAYTLSEHNVIDNDELETFEYQYNDYGYPINITSYYNGHKRYTMQVEYLAPK